MNELDNRAEAYARTAMNNSGEVFSRSDLYEYIIEAYKQGWADRGEKGMRLGSPAEFFADTLPTELDKPGV